MFAARLQYLESSLLATPRLRHRCQGLRGGSIVSAGPSSPGSQGLSPRVIGLITQWVQEQRAGARPADARWHDAVAAALPQAQIAWWRALLDEERERIGDASLTPQLLWPLRPKLRDHALTGECDLLCRRDLWALRLGQKEKHLPPPPPPTSASVAELHAELTLATSIQDATADAAIEPVLRGWAAAGSPEKAGLGLERGVWETYAPNEEAAVAALRPLTSLAPHTSSITSAATGGAFMGVLTAEDRIAAVRNAARAWHSNGVPAASMDVLGPLLLWALAKVHAPPAAPLRLASHVAFVMRFLDTDRYSPGSEEMWGAMQLELAFRAALGSQDAWPAEQWRYVRSAPGWLRIAEGE
jgi:hypothetical protein